MQRFLRTLREVDLGHLAVIGAVVAAMTTFMFSHQVFNDGDTYWHLSTGRWILEHGKVPTKDVFSYTMAGHEWQAHEWLADVFMYGAYQLGGWAGLTVLFGLVAALGAGMLTLKVAKSLGSITLICMITMALAATNQSLLIRPHALMLPILIFWTIQMMEAREQDRAPPLALAAIMIVWANLHASYIFGFVVAGAFGLEALWEAPAERRVKVFRDWALFGILSVIAVVLTPFGIAGVIFPFKVMSFSFLNDIMEWRPADFSTITAFEVALLLALFVCLSRGVRLKPMRALLLITLFQMALQHRRQVIVLVLLAPLILAEPMARALGQTPRTESEDPKRQDWRAAMIAAAALALVIIGARFFIPLERMDDRTTPRTAMKAVPANVRAMPVLNDYTHGGYLTFLRVKPYIDGRADMYGDEYVTEYMKLIHTADPNLLDQIIKKNKVAWTIFSKNDVMVGAMDRRADFHCLFADGFAAVHVRNDVLAPVPGKPLACTPPLKPAATNAAADD